MGAGWAVVNFSKSLAPNGLHCRCAHSPLPRSRTRIHHTGSSRKFTSSRHKLWWRLELRHKSGKRLNNLLCARGVSDLHSKLHTNDDHSQKFEKLRKKGTGPMAEWGALLAAIPPAMATARHARICRHTVL